MLYTTINEYRKYLKINEEVGDDSINSEINVKRDRIEKYIDAYNKNKSKLNSIAELDVDSKRIEEEANKVIDGNPYLQMYWKYTKIQKEVNDLEEKTKSSDLTEDEKNDVREDLKQAEEKMLKYNKELNDQIKNDQNEIK